MYSGDKLLYLLRDCEENVTRGQKYDNEITIEILK